MIDVEKLDKDSILSDETFLSLLEEKDQMIRARLLVDCGVIAKKYGLKQQFDTLYKAFKTELRQQTNKMGNYTNFDGDYPDMKSGNWVANEDGIYTLTMFGEQEACSHPILPIRILINAESGQVRAVLAFKMRGRWKEIVVDKDVLSSSNKITALANLGVRVTSENARALVRYLSDIESLNEASISEQASTSKLGWTKLGFMPYDRSVMFDSEDSVRHVFDSIHEEGKFERWLDLLQDIRSRERTEVLLYLAGAFASPLLHKLHALPFIIDLYGETGRGKTVALMVATSIWADPTEGHYWIRSDNTSVGLETMLDLLNHLPLALDDLSQLQDKLKGDFSQYIYTLCAGGGRMRSNVKLGLQRQRTWKNIILTSSERSLINDTTQGGAINRIIEIESNGYIFDEGEGPRIVALIKENYGFAGKMFLDAIEEIGMDGIKEIQGEFLKRISNRCQESADMKEEKQIIPMSILLTADRIATDYIFKDGIYLDFDTCYDLLKSHEDVSENERAYEFIISEIQIHQNNFEPDANGQYKGEIWGEYKKGGYVAIINNVFENMCKKGNVSGKSLKKWASCNDKLTTDKDGKFTVPQKINGNLIRCVMLKVADDIPQNVDIKQEFHQPDEEEQERLPFYDK